MISTTLGRYLESTFVLTMLDTYTNILSQTSRRSKFHAAMIGNFDRVENNSEALFDGGLRITGRFLKPQTRALYDEREISQLKSADYDLYLVGGRDLSEEHHALKLLLEQIEGDGVSHSPIYLCNKIIDGVLETFLRIEELRSCLNIRKLATVSQILACTPADGVVAECGVYQGGTTLFLAKLMELWQDPRRIFAFDTFQGMPNPTEADGETIYQSTMFTDNPLTFVENYYRQNGVMERITAAKGLVQETLPAALDRSQKISFALIDTDQYAGTAASLSVMVPLLTTNGVLVVDDYSLQGVRLAVDEALRMFPSLRGAELTQNFYMLWDKTDSTFMSSYRQDEHC